MCGRDRGHRISPFTVQAVPMLLLGVGVDYLVIMCHCMVGRCRLTVSEPVLKAPMVSALEATI